MERKIINYTIKYFKRGKDLEKRLVIKRVSRGAVNKYSEIVANMAVIEAICKQRDTLVQQFGECVSVGKIKERADKARPVWAQIQQLDEQLKAARVNEVFGMCVGLVADILDDNGIEDKDLCSAKWWEKHTEERDIWDFFKWCCLQGRSGQ